jgi:hypothetical protein
MSFFLIFGIALVLALLKEPGYQHAQGLSRNWLGSGTDLRSTSSPSHCAERQARWATVASGICW